VSASAELHPYPGLEDLVRETEELAAATGGEVRSFGSSVEGRPLLAVRVGQAPRRVLCCANIHGPELISSRVALGLLAAARSGDLAMQALLREAELWVVPCLNPDGYARTHAAQGREPLAALRPNAHGVDLNRNYPLPPGSRRTWLPGSGSSRPGAATYVGRGALSEPETAAVAALCRQQDFWASANLHAFMGRLIPPHTPTRSAHHAYRELCAAFQAAQPRPYPRLSSRWLDGFTGEQEDFQHHVLRTWALCVETFPVGASLGQHLLAPTVFWRFNPRDPEPWVHNDVPGIVAFFLAALARPRPD
jgi:hypothetical protein